MSELTSLIISCRRRVDVVGETLRAQDARQDALTVEDILAQRHRALQQGADAVQHGLVDRVLRIDVLRQGCDLLGDHLHQVGVVVDAHLQQRNEEVVARRIAAVVHLKTFFRFTEGAELGAAHRNQHTLVRNDERHGLHDERIARRHEEVGVGDDGVLRLGILRRGLDLLNLLLGLEADLHKPSTAFCSLMVAGACQSTECRRNPARRRAWYRHSG